VRDALAPLSYPSPDAASVAIHADEEKVVVTFGAPAGLQRGPRSLSLAPDCERRAGTVALLIAAWLGQLTAAPAPSLDLVSDAPLPPRVKVGPRAAAGPPPEAVTELGAGLMGADENGALVPGLHVEIAWTTWTANEGIGWRVIGELPAPKVERFSSTATALWTRPLVGIDAHIGQRLAGLRVEENLAALLGLTFVWGHGFSTDGSDNAMAPGLGGGVRVISTRSGVGWWATVQAHLWLSQQTVAPDAFVPSVALPFFELQLVAGASLPL
jgi:hypothetical protein